MKMSRKRIFILLACGVLAVAALTMLTMFLLAPRGGYEAGYVVAVTSEHVVVRDERGIERIILIDEMTSIKHGDVATSSVPVGSYVIISVEPIDHTHTARRIRILEVRTSREFWDRARKEL